MKTYSLHILILMIALLPHVGMAQERTAGSNLQVETTWTALSTMLNATNGNVTMLRTDMNVVKADLIAMKACGAQKKIWTGTQCVDPGTMDSIVNCGKSGKIFNGTACVGVSGSNRWVHLGGFSGSSITAGGARNSVQSQINDANASRKCGSGELAGRQCSKENTRCSTEINCDVEHRDGKANRYTCTASYLGCH